MQVTHVVFSIWFVSTLDRLVLWLFNLDGIKVYFEISLSSIPQIYFATLRLHLAWQSLLLNLRLLNEQWRRLERRVDLRCFNARNFWDVHNFQRRGWWPNIWFEWVTCRNSIALCDLGTNIGNTVCLIGTTILLNASIFINFGLFARWRSVYRLSTLVIQELKLLLLKHLLSRLNDWLFQSLEMRTLAILLVERGFFILFVRAVGVSGRGGGLVGTEFLVYHLLYELI